jgi:Putative  PD-(D/E)XK family member, (DUF4420)
MVPPDLFRLYELLLMPMPTPSNDLSAVPFPGAETHRLAKDSNGSPCLLIRQPGERRHAAPIRLQNLSVSFDVPCTITQPGQKQELGTFTIVRCSSVNPRLFPHFLKIVSPIVTVLGPTPTPAMVRRAISGLVELFQALAAPPRKTIQGIWAEVLLIRLSSDPRIVATAWHRDPEEHFDFAEGPQRIEVKSSSNRRREHYFSLEQLTLAGTSRIVVASVFVERAGGGVSLQKIFNDTRGLLGENTSIATRFDAVFYKSLGSSWADAMDECFDWELALESLAFYSADTVPRVENPLPQAIFDVRFRSDLGSATPLVPQQQRELGGLFAAALPTG